MWKNYNIPRSEQGKEENKRILYSLHEICKRNSWKHIGVLSSTKLKKDIIVKTLQKTAEELGMEEYTFHELEPLFLRADVIHKIHQYDAVLLAEKYNYTKYSEFEETLKLLKEYQINVIGVVEF